MAACFLRRRRTRAPGVGPQARRAERWQIVEGESRVGAGGTMNWSSVDATRAPSPARCASNAPRITRAPASSVPQPKRIPRRGVERRAPRGVASLGRRTAEVGLFADKRWRAFGLIEDARPHTLVSPVVPDGSALPGQGVGREGWSARSRRGERARRRRSRGPGRRRRAGHALVVEQAQR